MERAASVIPDVCRYVLDRFGFQSRRHVLRVFKLCCLIVGEPTHECPSFSIDLSGCGVTEESVYLCCRIVQSDVLSDDYSPQSLFTESTLGLIRDAIANGGIFFVGSDFSV